MSRAFKYIVPFVLMVSLPLLTEAKATPKIKVTTIKKAPTPTMEVTGWIPYWRATKGVADVAEHIAQFTSIMPFGFTVTTSGDLYDAANIGLDPWVTLLATAHANHVKVIPTVMWANGAAIDAVLRDPTSRANHEDQIVSMVTDGNFDGVDIDYEGKMHETKPYFSKFLKELHKKLAAKGVKKLLYCTIEARTPLSSLYAGQPPSGAGQYANDFRVINRACDRVQLMTYDQETVDVKLTQAASSTPYIPVADPAWVRKVITLAARTISKKKLEIGIATYGYEWQVTPLQNGFKYDLQWAFNPTYATTLASELNLVPQRNRAGELSVSYLPTTTPQSTAQLAAAGGATDTSSGSGNQTASTTFSDGGTAPPVAPSFNLLWWSDAKAVSQEVKLAEQLGVKGVAIFKLDGGEDQNIWGVLPKATH